MPLAGALRLLTPLHDLAVWFVAKGTGGHGFFDTRRGVGHAI